MYGLPDGRPERDINIAQLALSLDPTFVARGYSGDINQLTEIIKKAVNHKGCSIVEVMQYCPTYNPEASPMWFQEHISKIDRPYLTAEEASKEADLSQKIITGVIFENTATPAFDEMLKNRKDMETELVDEVKQFDITNLLNEFK